MFLERIEKELITKIYIFKNSILIFKFCYILKNKIIYANLSQ